MSRKLTTREARRMAALHEPRPLSTREARRMSKQRRVKVGGRNGGRPSGAVSAKPRCACGCGLTLERAMKRHPGRARA